MGSIAFSDVILLKRNVKPENLRKWCDFHKKMWRALSETAEETEVRCSRHRQRDRARCEGLSTQLREECLQQLSYAQGLIRQFTVSIIMYMQNFHLTSISHS